MNKSCEILQRASWAFGPFGVLAFWVGMVMAALRYPSEYDWRFMPVSHLLSPLRDPAGYLWASAGIVLYSLCGFCWTALVARRWKHEDAENRPSGIRALQFGYFLAIGAGVLPPWLLRMEKGHELLTVSAFAGLCFGMVRLMFQTIERTLMRRMGRLSGHARVGAAILASAAVFPIVLAGLAQAFVHYAHPELHWVNLSWRDRGVPIYLSFNFWEWLTCVLLGIYTVILSQALSRRL
jgi:hypothetical protein